MDKKEEILKTIEDLNNDNINLDSSIREKLFTDIMNLISVKGEVKNYVTTLIPACAEEFLNDYKNAKPGANYNIYNNLINHIGAILDNAGAKDNYTLFSEEYVFWGGNVMAVEKIIEVNPTHFNFFKQKIEGCLKKPITR